MDVDQFINQTNGQHIDEDGYYGAQCWDLVARYARVVVGCPSFPTGSGGAEGLYRLFQDPIPQYFDRIANDPNDPNQLPQKGDVIVWMASFSPPYGHTALVISADPSGPTVLEQNGNNPGGVAYIKKRNWVGVYGWLRPKQKGEPMSKTDLSIARILTFGILGRNGADGTDNALGGGTDADLNQFHVNTETNGEIWSLYNSGEGQNWINNRLPNLIKQAASASALGKQLSDANTALAGLQQQVNELGKRPTQEQLDALTKAVTDANNKAVAAQAALEKANAQKAADTQAGDTFLRRLGQFIQKYL